MIRLRLFRPGSCALLALALGLALSLLPSSIAAASSGEAELTIENTAPPTILVSQTFSYALKVENHGPDDASEVAVFDPVSSHVEFVEVESADGVCVHVLNEVECKFGTLKPGEEASAKITVKALGVSEVENTARVESPTAGPGSREDEATTQIEPAIDLWLEMTGPAEVEALGEIPYKIHIENRGPLPATEVEVLDVLPSPVRVVSLSPGCRREDVGIHCNLAELPANGSADFEIVLKLRAVTSEPIVNEASGSGSPGGSGSKHNSATVTTTVGPSADLGIVQTAPPVAELNSQFAYELHVVNSGPDQATGVEVVDPLPTGIEFVSASPGCEFEAGTVVCKLAELAVNDGADFEIVVRAPTVQADDQFVNTATVSGGQPDPEPDNDNSTATTEVRPEADLGIVETMGEAQAGKPLTYTLGVTNHGPSGSSDAVVEDSLPAGVGFSSASSSQGSCSATDDSIGIIAIDSTIGIRVTCDLGPLAAGGSAQVTIVTFVPAVLANTTLRNSSAVGGPERDPNHGNNVSTAEAVVAPAAKATPDLHVVKTVDTASPKAGRPYHYTVTITNRGAGAARHVKVLDALSGPAKILAAVPSSGHCHAKGSKLRCRLPRIAAGATATIVYTVVAKAAGKLSNVVSATSGNGDANPADNTAVKRVRVTRRTRS